MVRGRDRLRVEAARRGRSPDQAETVARGQRSHQCLYLCSYGAIFKSLTKIRLNIIINYMYRFRPSKIATWNSLAGETGLKTPHTGCLQVLSAQSDQYWVDSAIYVCIYDN